MARNKGALQAALLAMFEEAAGMEEGAEAARAMMAEKMATAIDNYAGALKVATGITVATTGTATSHTGATTAQGNIV